jgi:hypothetical protein
VPVKICSVTLTDDRGVKHSVDITAESVFEGRIIGARSDATCTSRRVQPG